MSEWKAKRFWTGAHVAPNEDGFGVHLDKRPLKTPAKQLLRLPTRALAEAVAAEWDAQEDVVRPDLMPLTRAANTAIDGVSPRRDAVVAEIAGYGESDLLCYRAPSPAELRARQAAAWDPLMDWAAAALGARLTYVEGVMPRQQPEASLGALRDEVERFTPFGLVGLHDLVALSGSLVLGLAVALRRTAPSEAWEVSRIDEAWHAEQWGDDPEAAALMAAREEGFLDAARLLSLLGEAARHP